jgi:membrane-bound serine protease (ClpP class)
MKHLFYSRQSIAWLTIVILMIVVGVAHAAPSVAAVPPVLVLTADGPLTPAMVEYLARGIRSADQDGAEVLVFELNTPGGSIELMNRMVQSIRSSDVPIVVYVSPRGAMAGSAGTILTLAGHAAAMAPETAIGAASPVGDSGQDLSQTEQSKTKNILKATVRSLAGRRNAAAIDLAQQTIETAQAVSEKEALNVGLIDFVATDINDLVRQLDGFKLRIGDSDRVLHTANAPVQPLPQTFVERVLAILTDPNILVLLLNIGIVAILIELSSPGGWISGFIGAVCLALAIYGMGIIPVNWFGTIFILLAFVLFILDIKAPTHGALTVAGIGSMIVAALVLFNSPNVPSFQRVSLPVVIFSSVITGGMFFAILIYALRAQKAPLRTGMQSLIGKTGVVVEAIDPHGQVQMAGELWSASLAENESALPVGARVQVVAISGIHLQVRRLST